MNEQKIIELRLLVGYLGEKGQLSWWPSNFFAPNSSAFLEPVFARTANLARYHGILEAARLVHDEHIGIGRVFHLFRLPEVLEQRLFELFQQHGIPPELEASLKTQTEAMKALEDFAGSEVEQREGPIQVGSIADLTSAKWLKASASRYFSAFQASIYTYPYLVDSA